jgi:hypothetical protein
VSLVPTDTMDRIPVEVLDRVDDALVATCFRRWPGCCNGTGTHSRPDRAFCVISKPVPDQGNRGPAADTAADAADERAEQVVGEVDATTSSEHGWELHLCAHKCATGELWWEVVIRYHEAYGWTFVAHEGTPPKHVLLGTTAKTVRQVVQVVAGIMDPDCDCVPCNVCAKAADAYCPPWPGGSLECKGSWQRLADALRDQKIQYRVPPGFPGTVWELCQSKITVVAVQKHHAIAVGYVNAPCQVSWCRVFPCGDPHGLVASLAA